VRRNGIFLKIYLWFWITTALIPMVHVGLDRLTNPRLPRSFHLEQSLGPALSLHSRTVLRRYEQNDLKGAAEAREDLQKTTGLDAFVIDPGGREITGRALTDDVRRAAVEATIAGRLKVSMIENGPLLALPAKGGNGASFVAVGRLLRAGPPPPPPPFRSPMAEASRLLVGLLVSAFVCYGLARYMTSPVMRLRDATRRFTEGELTVRIGRHITRRRDEFGGLADDFNRMAERIESLRTLQRQLLGDISHELRSPLTRLNVALEIARKKSDQEACVALDRIRTEADLLEEMISQVLTLTRLETGIQDVPITCVEMGKLVREIAADGNFEAKARNCAVTVAEGKGGCVKGNEELLRRAIENVIRNALRYTASGTTVEVSFGHCMKESGAYIQIDVADRGPGVPEADLPHLFRPFYRVSDARERQTGGTGLGLAITHRSVTFHRGIVTARNRESGGLVITVLLPLLLDELPDIDPGR
jgi:two-component system, OmpR family, sensor histidine kinase CpxA